MLNIQIPKDIREYETKFIGPFTFRQVAAIGLAAVIEIGVSTIIRKFTGGAIISYTPALPFAAIPLIFGFGDKFLGMPVEKFLQTNVLEKITRPAYRPYKTHNYLDIQLKKLEMEEAASNITSDQKQKKKKKTPTDIPPELKAYQ